MHLTMRTAGRETTKQFQQYDFSVWSHEQSYLASKQIINHVPPITFSLRPNLAPSIVQQSKSRTLHRTHTCMARSTQAWPGPHVHGHKPNARPDLHVHGTPTRAWPHRTCMARSTHAWPHLHMHGQLFPTHIHG